MIILKVATKSCQRILFLFQEFAVPNCIEGATYDPWKSIDETATAHNYREGNLPANSKYVKDSKLYSVVNLIFDATHALFNLKGY